MSEKTLIDDSFYIELNEHDCWISSNKFTGTPIILSTIEEECLKLTRAWIEEHPEALVEPPASEESEEIEETEVSE